MGATKGWKRKQSELIKKMLEEHVATNQVSWQQLSNMTGYKKSSRVSEVKLGRGPRSAKKMHVDKQCSEM